MSLEGDIQHHRPKKAKIIRFPKNPRVLVCPCQKCVNRRKEMGLAG